MIAPRCMSRVCSRFAFRFARGLLPFFGEKLICALSLDSICLFLFGSADGNDRHLGVSFIPANSSGVRIQRWNTVDEELILVMTVC